MPVPALFSSASRARYEGSLGTPRAKEAEAPADQRLEPALEAGQEADVDDHPHQPAEKARDADAMEADDRAAPGHRRHAPEVAVLEGLRLLAVEPAADRPRRVNTRLKSNLGDARQVV